MGLEELPNWVARPISREGEEADCHAGSNRGPVIVDLVYLLRDAGLLERHQCRGVVTANEQDSVWGVPDAVRVQREQHQTQHAVLVRRRDLPSLGGFHIYQFQAVKQEGLDVR